MASAILTHQETARTGLFVTELLITAVALVATIIWVSSHYVKHSRSDDDSERTWDTVKQCVLIGVFGAAAVVGGLAFSWYLMMNF
jgi:hypothetical protein